MKVSTTTSDRSTVVLDVEVPAERVRSAVDEAVRHQGARVRIPGFRPGKVPRQMLERALGVDRSDPANPDPIYDDARDHLYRGSVIDALRTQAELDILEIPGRPEWASFSELSGARYRVAIPVRPTVTLGDYASFTFEPQIDEVTDEKVDQVIEQLRDQQASLAPVEGRPAAKDDYAVISFRGTRDGEPVEGAEAERFPLVIGGGLALAASLGLAVSNRDIGLDPTTLPYLATASAFLGNLGAMASGGPLALGQAAAKVAGLGPRDALDGKEVAAVRAGVLPHHRGPLGLRHLGDAEPETSGQGNPRDGPLIAVARPRAAHRERARLDPGQLKREVSDAEVRLGRAGGVSRGPPCGWQGQKQHDQYYPQARHPDRFRRMPAGREPVIAWPCRRRRRTRRCSSGNRSSARTPRPRWRRGCGPCGCPPTPPTADRGRQCHSGRQ